MSDQISGDNSNVAVDNQSGPTDQQVDTSQVNGQSAGQSEHVDELFQGVDPNKLPPQLKAQHDNMVKTYREKTQKLSETLKAEIAKATAPFEQKAKTYEQFAQQEEFVKQWNEYVEKTNGSMNGKPGEDPGVAQMKAQLNEINQKMQASEMAQITNAFADAVDDKGQALHGEFDKLNEIYVGKLQDGSDFSLLRACVELSQGTAAEKLTSGYKMAEAVYKGIFEAGKKAGMGRLETKKLNGSIPPTNTIGEVLSTTDQKPKSAREALALAKRGVMVSRD